ncbi:MAG: hypothetical protein IJV25_02575 [Prevotella sp.]|nr:hypothetical protein [Prevotella sp.]
MKPVEAALWRKNARRSEKKGKTFGSVEKYNYLCTRKWRMTYGLVTSRSKEHRSLLN